MGWIWSEEHEMWCDGSERDADGRLTFANPDELDWINDDPDELGNQAPWTPLTDMNQCFMVVERMRELGFYLLLTNGVSKFCASFRAEPLFTTVSQVWEIDPCLAILKAARATKD